MNTQIVRCKKCLMPRDTAGLSFDENGICELCTDYSSESHPDDRTKSVTLLNDTIEQIKTRGKGASFDCVVGVSGGMDSTYLLYSI